MGEKLTHVLTHLTQMTHLTKDSLLYIMVPEPGYQAKRFNRIPQEVSTRYRVEMNCGFSAFVV